MNFIKLFGSNFYVFFTIFKQKSVIFTKINENFIYYEHLIKYNRTKTPGSDAKMYPVVKL